ncbi:hypothetical protein BH23CHL1_BH23CHL1_10710 [soil metagenome]
MPRVLERQPRWTCIAAALILSLTLAACSGPDDFGDDSQTPATAELSTPTNDVDATPTGTARATPTIDDATGTPPVETPEAEPATPTVEQTPTVAETPEPETTPTPEVEPTATQEALGGVDALPRLDELSEGGYIVADQGERSQEQLAQAYADPTAHLLRLEEWGFRQHVYREFTRQSVEDGALPNYVLATVNVYGSPEQADIAFQWLEDLQINQGARTAAAPELGDAAVAITVATAQGIATASVYIRYGSSTYIYYAEGGDPLPRVISIAEQVFGRIGDQSRQAALRWPSQSGFVMIVTDVTMSTDVRWLSG